MDAKSRHSPVRFGPFEANLDTGELSRGGRRVALQQQPFSVLRMLLSRPGEVVTRDELRNALWPSDTFVDFEAGLNAAIKRVRRALDDTADNPRYISTLPRRGYSFIAPVAEGEARTAALPPRRARVTRVALAAVLAGLALVGYLLRPMLSVPEVQGIVALTPPLKIPPSQILATDGPSVFFSLVSAGGRRELVKVPSSGGPVTPIALPSGFQGNTEILDISPDGAELLVRRLEDQTWSLWTVPAEGGPPKRFSDLDSLNATWMPDDSGIVFARGNSLYAADRNGENIRLVTHTPGEPMDPRWSPDNRYMRYTVYDQGRNRGELWTYDARRGDARPLRPPLSITSAGVWSDGGQFYLFGTSAVPSSILARPEQVPFWRRRNLSPTALTTGPLSYSSPTLSRDRRHLFAIGAMDRGELEHFTPGVETWQPFLDGGSMDALAYSKDGRWLVYVSYPDRTLWREDRHTGSRLQLVHAPGASLMPHWSPDGRNIEYTQVVGSTGRLMMLGSDGNQVTALTPAGLDAWQASWSPSGKQLAVVYRHLPKDEPQRLGVLDLATRRITDVPDSSNWGNPEWSPDGENLLARKPGPHGLTVYSFREQRWRDIPAPSDVNYPTWSPDGRSFVFNTLGGDRPGIYRIRVLDAAATRFGPAQLLIDLKGFVPAGSYGDWSGLDPEGGFLLLRDVGWSAIYRMNWRP